MCHLTGMPLCTPLASLTVTLSLQITQLLVLFFGDPIPSPVGRHFLERSSLRPLPSVLSFSPVTLPVPLIVSLCASRCRQHMNLNSSVMHLPPLWSDVAIVLHPPPPNPRHSLELPPDMPPPHTPALVKWDVSPLCAPANTGGFCVHMCVCEWSALAWFASLHTNAGEMPYNSQGSFRVTLPQISGRNILYGGVGGGDGVTSIDLETW